MKLKVDRLTATPTEHHFEARPEWWATTCSLLPELAVQEGQPLALRVFAHRMGSDVYLEGDVSGGIDLACSRCATRYRHPLLERFRLVLEPAAERVPGDPEGCDALERDGVWLGDELETGWFRGPVLDLGTCVREIVALALPVQPLCQEDCRGLCPRCGIDRNVETCECPTESRHSPFAVLSALKRETES